MDNGTVSEFSSQAYIYDAYITVTESYMAFVCFTILIYASCLHFGDEVKYIWKRKFTLPAYLYLLSKYPLFLYFTVTFVEGFWPVAASSLRLCNDFGNLIRAITILPFIGVQGLISVRTYSLCRGYRPMLIALSVTFLASFTLYMYKSTTRSVPGCSPTPDSFELIINLINITILLSDILAFITVVWQVWGLWRLKQGLGLQHNDSSEDLVTSILRQGVLRFCFVILISATGLFLGFFAVDVSNFFGSFQNILSSIIICEFTLDLRRRNTPTSVHNPSALDLPTLSFREDPVQSVRSVLGRFHEGIVAEMGERPINYNAGLNLDVPDDFPNAPGDMDLVEAYDEDQPAPRHMI